MKKIIFGLLLLLAPSISISQDSTKTKLSFESDFRFRAEEDWNSKKSDGTLRDDRTRFRYRLRVGLTYEHNDNFSFGARIRTSEPNKQQDPNLTLGEGYKEFSTLPIGFETVYAKYKNQWFSAWVGKNTFPFEKQNELFWSDAVFPEGISLSGTFGFENALLQGLTINAGHFIVAASGNSLDSDSYFEGIQVSTSLLKNKLTFYPSLYYFHKMPDIPDGGATFTFDYSIIDLGAKFEIQDDPKIVAGVDYYTNVKDLNEYDLIPDRLKDQTHGFVTSLSLGTLQQKHDWTFMLTYAYMERYAAVDFFAQNDWVRWDYSSQGSPDGRLTNFKGFEFLTGYALAKKINLKLAVFIVDQIIPYGIAKETGNRVRLDFNIAL